MLLNAHQTACLQTMDITLYDQRVEKEDALFEWIEHLRQHQKEKVTNVKYDDIAKPQYEVQKQLLILPKQWDASEAELKRLIWAIIQ